MEQDQNVLAITRSLDEKLHEIGQALPEGVEIVATYDRSAWIWSTLEEFFATLVTELIVLILVTTLFLGNLRTSVGPDRSTTAEHAVYGVAAFFFDQTINLFSLAGLCIAIGEIADATIVIVENCAAELSLRPNSSRVEKREIIVQSIAIGGEAIAVFAADHPCIVPSGVLSRRSGSPAVRSTGLQQDIRDGLLDSCSRCFLCRSSLVWIFERDATSVRTHHGDAIALRKKSRRAGARVDTCRSAGGLTGRRPWRLAICGKARENFCRRSWCCPSSLSFALVFWFFRRRRGETANLSGQRGRSRLSLCAPASRFATGTFSRVWQAF